MSVAGILAVILAVLAAVGWLAAALRGRTIRQLRGERADREMQVGSLESQLAGAQRQVEATGAAGMLERLLREAGSSVPRGTVELGSAPPMCTACDRRTAQGRRPVQGCSDCYWLECGSPTDVGDADAEPIP